MNVHLLVNTLTNATLVPSQAVQSGAPGSYVYVVNPDDTVHVQTVTTGPTDGTNTVITKGISPGDVVVTDGVDRLTEGAKVVVAITPTAAPSGQAGGRGHMPGGITISRVNPAAAASGGALEPGSRDAVNPSKIFILRPVATSLLMIAFVLVGLVAFKFLPVSALPDVNYPTIQVQTFYPGASPEVMTSSVTAPLERQLGEMEGLNQMSSASSAGRLGDHACNSICR